MPLSEEPRFVPGLRFPSLTPFYDLVVQATTREATIKTALVSQADIRAGSIVLDVGSGTGTLAILAKTLVPSAIVSGVDVDAEMLSASTEKAERAGVSIPFIPAMSDRLPYPDRYFDRVMSSLVFHHLSWDAKQRTAGEIFRVLAPGGELHVADWDRPSNPLMRALFLPVQLLDGFRNTQDNVEGRLLPLFEQAGFAAVRRRRSFATVFGTLSLLSAVKP